MSEISKEWQRPITTRRYVHPPMADSMVTLWSEGKIIYGENYVVLGNDYYNLISRALWFVYGENALSADFKTVQNKIYENGIPVQTLVNKYGNLSVETETFCSIEKSPVCYIKVTLSNLTEKAVAEKFGFLLRTGKECDFVVDAPDVYVPYNIDMEKFKNIPVTWNKNGKSFSDGKYCINISGECDFSWDEKSGCALTDIALNPNESLTFYMALASGEAEFDYQAEKEKAIKYWEKELLRINKIPKNLKADKKAAEMIKSLTIQMMQCFCRYKDADFILARQGCLQRQVWTFETLYVLQALGEIGDFDDYIEPIIDIYFNGFQSEDGEIVPLGIQWAMSTGNVLFSFAKFAEKKGKDYYLKYRDKAISAFEWMKKTRASTEPSEKVAKGLFPPMASCDDRLVFQNWLLTDTVNLMGIYEFAKICEKFGDSKAQDIRDEYNDYMSYMKKYWQDIYQKEKSADEIAPPYSPLLPNDTIAPYYAFGQNIEYLIYLLDMSEQEAGKLLKYNFNRGIIKNGLYQRMPDKVISASTRYNLDQNGKCVVWYVVNYEYYIFLWFMKHGKREKAKEVLDGAENYAMTDEYYMVERYNHKDPYFAPWSPNASANGRMIIMLLKYYGGNE